MNARRDDAEIVRLYEDTSDELRRMLVRKLHDEHEAQEVAHDAFLKLCQMEHRGDIRDLRKYLFSMSFRLALNVLRRRRLEHRYAAPADDAAEPVDDVSAYRALLGELKMDAVRQALAALPEKTRHVFLLNRFDGLTYGEVARKLGISQKTVEYHMKQALAALLQATDVFATPD